MSTNIQPVIERQRVVYESLARPLLAQMAELHGISIRDFGQMFGISKTYAAEILNHEKLPNLDLAIRMARYWETTIEELFGWRVDDDGSRRPLVVDFKGTLIRLKPKLPEHGAISFVLEVAEEIRKLQVKRKAERDAANDTSCD
jgi:transcriptional regulator with XRE-family HTH domain